jgi:hypothetical protein
MTTQEQGSTESQGVDRLAQIEQRVARIQFFTAWMLTLMVLGVIVGLIVGIVIAVNVYDVANPSPF